MPFRRVFVKPHRISHRDKLYNPSRGIVQCHRRSVGWDTWISWGNYGVCVRHLGLENNHARLILRRKTDGQELQPWTAVSTLLGLVSTVWQVMKSLLVTIDNKDYEVISWLVNHPLNADFDDLRWNSNPNFCRMANVTCKMRDKG